MRIGITLEDYCITAIIGIYPAERLAPQNIFVRASFEYDFNGTDYIDYTELVERITAIVQKKQFLLLEEAVQYIANELQRHYSTIYNGKISLCKPAVLPQGQIWVSHAF